LFAQLASLAWSFAPLSAGNKSAERIAMMAITTNNSIKVNPLPRRRSSISTDTRSRRPAAQTAGGW
jgi:hypothetical protein